MADILRSAMFIKDLFRGEVRDALQRVHAARAHLREQVDGWPAVNIEIEDDQHNVLYRLVFDEGQMIPRIEPPLPAEPAPDQPTE